MKVYFDENGLRIEHFLVNWKLSRLSIYANNDMRLTYIDIVLGYWSKTTYNTSGKKTGYRNSTEYWEKIIYDDSGNMKAFENGTGSTR